MKRRQTLHTLLATIAAGTLTAMLPVHDLRAADKDHNILLADGKVSLKAPAEWARKQPRTRIVEHEFAAPAAEGDPVDGRLTVMGAGGSVEANIDRWIGQFSQHDGRPTREQAKVEKRQIAGQEVHSVDISGNYHDQPGPFAPAVVRENYRMLGAVIVTENLGQYFLKFYGPRKTIDAHEEAFQQMLETLKVK